jgi:Phosphoesterase family
MLNRDAKDWGGMSQNIGLNCTIVLVTSLLWLLAPGIAPARTTDNLLVNGNAEVQRCTNDWTAQTSIPGWRVTRGAASVLCYSAFTLGAETPITPSGGARGKALFAAPGADTAMEQMVDVGAAASAIDERQVRFDLSAWLGGWRDRPERATLTALFLDDDGKSTASPIVIADVDAEARGHLTGLVERRAKGLVPPGTRRIRVTLQFLSAMTSFQNAYADNISLTLSGDINDLEPAPLEPPVAHIPSLDHVYVVMMENTNFSDVVRVTEDSISVDPHMPFTASLARNGVILSNMWGTYHPSDQNYVAMVAGDTFKYGLTYYPDYNLPNKHLGDLLNARGKSWRAYVQDMKTPCNLQSQGAGRLSYSPDDEPFVHFSDVIDDADRCASDLRDLEDLKLAIHNDTLPDFAWIAPDNWWDGEGAWYENYDVSYSNARQDEFLRSALQPLLHSKQWENSRSLLILTWDESGGWGWPDNRVPTIVVGSPGLLRAGTVLREHVNGYDMLRTIESGLGVGTLGRFDQFAEPLNTLFAENKENDKLTHELWPAENVNTRGNIADTFGRVTTPAAVYRGQPVELAVAAGVDRSTFVNFVPLGQTPSDDSTPYFFSKDQTVGIPTSHLEPGTYGAWLRHGPEGPVRAPMMVEVLAPALLSPRRPGIEIIGETTGRSNTSPTSIREGSNLSVRYCLAAGMTAGHSWIGIFTVGTSNSELTKDNANTIGFWLKITQREGPRCGDVAAFASELAPGQQYEIVLLSDESNAASKPIGRIALFSVTPSLPH